MSIETRLQRLERKQAVGDHYPDHFIPRQRKPRRPGIGRRITSSPTTRSGLSLCGLFRPTIRTIGYGATARPSTLAFPERSTAGQGDDS
jgi:hypothetical protein